MILAIIQTKKFRFFCRHFNSKTLYIRISSTQTSMAKIPEEEKYRMMQCSFEVNPTHTLVKSLHRLRTEDPQVAELVALQLFDNAMVEAGLADDPRQFVNRINKILNLVLKEKEGESVKE